MTKKILNGQKKIESRWYMEKYAPWDRIKEGEAVYSKDSGEPVSLKAEVERKNYHLLCGRKMRSIVKSSRIKYEYKNNDKIILRKDDYPQQYLPRLINYRIIK